MGKSKLLNDGVEVPPPAADHQRTRTLPTGQRDAIYEGPDEVVALRRYRADGELNRTGFSGGCLS